MARILSVSLGVVLGLLTLELSLRLTIYEHEADRSYWGRGAFVTDADCVYRQSPDAVAVTGRRGVFGPVSLRTNAEGYRDPRLPDEPHGAPRLMVVGASTMFGLGVEDDAAIFPRQLERNLRSRADIPDDLQVFNISQTGYLSLELKHLVKRELHRVSPAMVLLVLTPNTHTTHFADRQIDIVNGYRLPRARPFPVLPVDFLRTHSYAFMQIASSPLTVPSAYYNQQLLWRALGPLRARPIPDEAKRSARGGKSDVIANVLEIEQILKKAGIKLACAVAYTPHQRRRWLTRMLRDFEIDVYELDVTTEWLIEGDGHWTERGHAIAAEVIGRMLPGEPFGS